MSDSCGTMAVGGVINIATAKEAIDRIVTEIKVSTRKEKYNVAALELQLNSLVHDLSVDPVQRLQCQ